MINRIDDLRAKNHGQAYSLTTFLAVYWFPTKSSPRKQPMFILSRLDRTLAGLPALASTYLWSRHHFPQLGPSCLRIRFSDNYNHKLWHVWNLLHHISRCYITMEEREESKSLCQRLASCPLPVQRKPLACLPCTRLFQRWLDEFILYFSHNRRLSLRG